MKILILRHAERKEIQSHKSNRSTPLTENGKKNSFFLGNAMSLLLPEEQKIVIATSNMKRTIDTGKYFAEGFGKEKVGRFVQHPNLCIWHLNYNKPLDELNHRVVHDYVNMVNDWHAGKYKGYLHSMESIANEFENIIIHELASDTRVLIMITHDTLISALSFHYQVEKYKKEGVGYLSGLFKEDFFSQWCKWEAFDFSEVERNLGNINEKLENLAFIAITPSAQLTP